MEKITSEPTLYLPHIDFSPDGRLLIEGRSITENASQLFDPLIEFAEQLSVEHIMFDINLEYFNTSSSKKLLELLKRLDANKQIHSVQVNWHFEEGDEDSVETAEIYEECLNRIDFKYYEYAEITE
jgi:hypothetical protein